MTPPRQEPDPGLAGERTRLAWTRTAIAFAAVGAAILKSRVAAGVAVIALGGVVWLLGRLFHGAALARTQHARMLGITATVVAAAAVALVIALTGHSGGMRLR
jgi:uncharacterized membrane protein YidH (DUF202 family)